MAKFKPARGKGKGGDSPAKAAVPCVVIIISGILLISLLFFTLLRQG